MEVKPEDSSSVTVIFCGVGVSFPNPCPDFLDFFFLANKMVLGEDEEEVSAEVCVKEDGDTNAFDRIGRASNMEMYFIVMREREL